MGEKMSGDASFAIGAVGIILFVNLACGIAGFIIGRTTAQRGPTRTIEVYEGSDVPF